MPRVPIIMPQLGESIAEATVVNLLVKPGEEVAADQDVIEVETNKATMNVTAPGAGRVDKFVVKLNESYSVGALLGYVEVSKEEAARLGIDNGETTGTSDPILQKKENGRDELTKSAHVEPTVKGLPVPAHALGATYM